MTISRLLAVVRRLDEGAGEDEAVGVALHGVAWLLELHTRTRESGDVYAAAARHLAGRVDLLADCLHGQARTVNQHHANEPERLLEALEFARAAQELVRGTEYERLADRSRALEGLLMQHLAKFPEPGESKLDLLRAAKEVIEDSHRRRVASLPVDDPELLRSAFNGAGVRIALAKDDREAASKHLDDAWRIYVDVATGRRAIYGRDIHPHVAACLYGQAVVDYYRALLLHADPVQRADWLRRATDNAADALRQRQAQEGSLDLDESVKSASLLSKIALARSASPVATDTDVAGLVAEAMREASDGGVIIESLPPLPSIPAEAVGGVERWIRSRAVAQLIDVLDSIWSDDAAVAETLASLEALLEDRSRAGSTLFLSPIAAKAVPVVARALGLVPTTPPNGRYDEVVVAADSLQAALAFPRVVGRWLADGSVDASSVTVFARPTALDPAGAALAAHALGSPPATEDDAAGLAVDAAGFLARAKVTAVEHPRLDAHLAAIVAERPAARVLVVASELAVRARHADALRGAASALSAEVFAAAIRPGSVDRVLGRSITPAEYLAALRETVHALRELVGAVQPP